MPWKKRSKRADETPTRPFPAPPAPILPAQIGVEQDHPEDEIPLVLVVVDGQAEAEPARAAFRALGYRIRVETDQNAVFALDQEAPDVVYLDCWRGRMDPLTFLNHTQLRYPKLTSSVIALVPEDDDGFRRDLLRDAGVEALLSPPLTAGSVAGAVGKVRLKDVAKLGASTVKGLPSYSPPTKNLADLEKEYQRLKTDDSIAGLDLEALPATAITPVDVDPNADLEEGAVIDGRYDVRGLFGRGGAAVVYRVYDRELDKEVALKLLKAETLDPHAEKRFQRELLILAALANPNVVNTFDGGRYLGRPYFTMEALEGRTLRQFMREQPSTGISVTFGIDLLLHICRGLAATHRMGVIHRDIKPSNLFVVGDGPQVKLTDFGIARDTEPSSAMTTLGIVVGTPGYVAPERLVVGGPHEPSSDIFSLGVVGYELFARRRPFRGRNPVDLLRAMTETQPVALATLNPAVPPSLDVLLRSMIASEPELRPPSVIEIARELRAIGTEARRRA